MVPCCTNCHMSNNFAGTMKRNKQFTQSFVTASCSLSFEASIDKKKEIMGFFNIIMTTTEKINVQNDALLTVR